MLDPENSAHTQQSLYSRLGGYDVIAAFIHDLMPRLRTDPVLAVYWKGISDDSAQKGDQLTINFICAAFDGPVHYSGRDMSAIQRARSRDACASIRNGAKILLTCDRGTRYNKHSLEIFCATIVRQMSVFDRTTIPGHC